VNIPGNGKNEVSCDAVSSTFFSRAIKKLLLSSNPDRIKHPQDGNFRISCCLLNIIRQRYFLKSQEPREKHGSRSYSTNLKMLGFKIKLTSNGNVMLYFSYSTVSKNTFRTMLMDISVFHLHFMDQKM
jgi:hypothetical protein